VLLVFGIWLVKWAMSKAAEGVKPYAVPEERVK
jgi:hypothetical protein